MNKKKRIKRYISVLILLVNIFFSVKGQENTIWLVDSLPLQEKYLNEINSVSVLKHSPIEVSNKLVRAVLDKQPALGVYKDNMMVTGVPINKTPTKSNSDIFFQFSIRHRITKSWLPFQSFLYLTYTQKSFWNVYESSSPFRDNNYNPGIGIGRYLILNNKLKGAFTLQLEHESNGRGGAESRSWNYVNFSGKYFYNMRTSIKAEALIPFVDGENNKDLLRYRGYGTISIDHIDKRNLWWFSLKLRPRDKFVNFNTEFSVAYKVSSKWNQYLMLHFYNGYGESLLDYKEFTSMVRIGFTIKPDFFNPY